jgi:CBS domain-containing protein
MSEPEKEQASEPVAARVSAPEIEVELEPGPAEPPPVPPRREPAGDDPAPLSVTSNLPARSWPPRVVADLMTRKVITVQEGDAVGDLEALMQRFRFHHLPVVTAEMKLVGLITRTDFLHARLGISPGGELTEKVGPETPAVAIMRRGVVTARPDYPLTTACRVMLHEKLGCLPVILENGTLVGIVTESDFARLALEMLERQGAA